MGELVHNLCIVNIQKTPLHYLCSLPIHSKIDDVMIGLMKELNLEIPQWHLTRYLKLSMCDGKNLCISGCDVDGTPFSLFRNVLLRNRGKRLVRMIDNKNHRDDEYKFILSADWNEETKDNDDDDSNGLNAELKFCGNYEEPKLTICLNPYLDELIESDGQIVLKMTMNISTKQWHVSKVGFGDDENQNDEQKENN